jgi:hypothetical protein
MNSYSLGDTICVLIWQAGTGQSHPLAKPLSDASNSTKRSIEVVNGETNTVVKVRIESIESDRVIGRVVENFNPDSPERENAREILSSEYDFDTNVVEQSGETRLMIRSTSDYENQWKDQQQKVLDQLPDRD